jgi:hypothetical protein
MQERDKGTRLRMSAIGADVTAAAIHTAGLFACAQLWSCRGHRRANKRRPGAQQLSEQFERVVQRLQHAPHER